MSYTVLYILVLCLSVLLFNSSVILARYLTQIKTAPEDADFKRLQTEKQGLEKEIDLRNAEIMELKMRIQELEKAPAPSPEASSADR